MKKKLIIPGVTAGILVSALVYGNLNSTKYEPTKVHAENENSAAQTVSTQNTNGEKQRLQNLMLNSIDHFTTAKGSFEYFTGDENVLVEYQTELGMNPKSFEKVKGIATVSHPTLAHGTPENGYEIASYDGEQLHNYNSGSPDFVYNTVTKSDKPETYSVKTPAVTQEEQKQFKDSTMKDRVVTDANGEKTYNYRIDPSHMGIAKTSLLPENFAMGYLEDLSKWNITGQEEIASVNTVIIEGQLNDYYTQKYQGNKFKLNVDPKTGIVLKMVVTDASGTVKNSLETKFIEIDKPVDALAYSNFK
ncbi:MULTISPECIES: hypothetical protein [Bacillus]|uniref:hypothetical protein n=1 Tax=Bacillus TaxID=1386 RepID=UPI001F567402|nr:MULTISPECIES: hypothetical protein [Bacillus cereus group]MDA1536438.1 hypothetical protein [Bacillus cereus group sp. TH254-2LC]MDA1547827.1 hypothetical protein [Bacillus cereus group sp. TH253LC]MDA1580958.1 hypothetical protein [Bacillus cereus group sp. TH228LC]MDA1629922.1 hypothetical protein [Bacillus cereus group sp. TH172LC]MDA1833844.1 hypothetical protein [Bacillus cereus group sp. BY142LC]